MNNNTTGEVTTYAWDCFNRMTAATLPDGSQAGFGYDPDGMLISQTSDGIERRFVQQNRFASREYVKNPQGGWEISASHVVNGTMLASHISSHSIGKTSQNGGRQQNTATHINYHPDHLGSVRLVTDEAGRIIDRTETDAYGSPLPHTANNATPGSQSNKAAKMLQPLNYTGTLGIRYVEKIKMHNMRARWHHPQTARFTSMDKLFATNRYNYVAGNPVMMVDPMGEHEIRYGNIKDIHTVEHHHTWERPAYMFALPSFNINGENYEKYRDIWLKLEKTKNIYSLTNEEMKIVKQFSAEAMRIKNETTNIQVNEHNIWFHEFVQSEKAEIIQERTEYNMNCAGLAFAGMKAVYILNNHITAVQGLLSSNYQIQSSKSIKDLKPGDVILQVPNIIDNKVDSFSHVRTVVATAKNNSCTRILIYEVDGYRPIVLTYFGLSIKLKSGVLCLYYQ